MGVFNVILETECCNKGALRLYEGKIEIIFESNFLVCGFLREHMYRRYYQNGNDAYRLSYYMPDPNAKEEVPKTGGCCSSGKTCCD